MAKEEALRKRAVVMYSDGKSVTEIARELGRSRQWVHKWIKRSKSKDGNGITDSAVRFGKEYSLPCFLQMDNELPRPLNPLSQDYQVTSRPVLNEDNLNEIRFIRLVRSDLVVSILNSEVHVRPELMYTYVEARLLVNQNRLLIIQDEKVVLDFDFLMPSV